MKILITLFTLLLSLPMMAQTINITDNDLQGGQTYNWTNDNVYLLDGLVFLEAGGKLYIEPGTVVKFTPRADVGNPSALIITPGAQIFAEGTAQEPIIFTAEADDVTDPSDLGPTDNSLWGGVALLGNGVTQKNGNAQGNLEGIDTSEPRGLYGGDNNADNSGVLKYVSIRHGGRQIVSGSELNGLTLAAVGSETVLDYIEVYANSDDGVEFFGGAPNLKHAVVAFAEDDSFDWDEVFTGKGQYWFSIQRSDIADTGGELDGSTPDDLSPSSDPTVYNWTHIGAGAGATASNPVGWLFRAGTAGFVANSIVTEMKNKAIEVQDKDAGSNDAHQKLVNGQLQISNNIFWNNGANTTIDGSATGIIRITSGQPAQDDPDASDLSTHLVNGNSVIADPQIKSVSREQDGILDPRPSYGSAAYTNPRSVYPAGDAFYTESSYAGAFSADPSQFWIREWTALSKNGHLADVTEGGDVYIVDADLVGNTTYNWTSNNTYILDGVVFLEEGGVLNIEPGTVVKFTPRADVGNPSALVITPGAKIYAEGTVDAPIIFTAEADDVTDPSDLGPTDNSLWGGLALLGRGVTQKNGNAIGNLEGIDTSEPRGQYGGTDNADNSGVLKYVSIRHGGRQIVSGSELNGLTLAAVGSETVLDYIEIYANSDDGVEFFGGAPNLKHAVVAFAEDDSFDWDEVFTGKGQFWFSIQREDIADTGGELDGSTPDDLSPSSDPTVYNWTHIGAGPGATASNPVGWLFRAGTAGFVANSIVTDMKNKAIEVQDKDAGTNDAHQKLVNGELVISNNIFWNNGANTAIDGSSTGIIRITSGQPAQDDPDASDLAAHLVSGGSVIADPQIRSISRDQDAGLDPRPTFGSAAYTNPRADYPAGDAFYDGVSYTGAFSADQTQLWIRNWTALETNGHLADPSTGGETIFIVDADLVGNSTYNWTNNNTYILDGVVFLEEGGVLNIEPGTVVKFTPRADVGNPSALVITPGAKIYAEGTVENPIIFTAEIDDVNDPFDLGPTDNSLWGGLALLGRGVTQKNGNAVGNLEGIDTSEPRGQYGGSDNTDNSGVLKYVSIRHGGRQIVSGSELNGLTLAAVGSGTTLDYIEIYANSDDGIEFFGGAPNLKHAAVAFAEDDSFDWDEVFTGKGQFWFSIQREDIADTGGELDGSTPDDLSPSSDPTVYNWTHIGSGPGATASNPVGWLFRAGTAGYVANSIVTEMKNKAIEVQDKDAGSNDAHQKLVNGELVISNNIFWNNGANTAIDGSSTGIIRITSGQPAQDDPDASDLSTHLITFGSVIADPQIQGISRDQDESLDPRPGVNGAAYTNPRAEYPAGDAFFDGVDYSGAFSSNGDEFWLTGWSTLSRNLHLHYNTTSTKQPDADDFGKFLVYPNPAFSNNTITVEAQIKGSYTIQIVTIDGRTIQTERSVTGEKAQLHLGNLNPGMYALRLIAEDGTIQSNLIIVQ